MIPLYSTAATTTRTSGPNNPLLPSSVNNPNIPAAPASAAAAPPAPVLNTFEWNNRAVQHLRRGNSSDAVLILLKTVFRLRKARAKEGLSQGQDKVVFSSSSQINDGNTSNKKPRSASLGHDTVSGGHQYEAMEEEEEEEANKFVANVPISTWPRSPCDDAHRPFRQQQQQQGHHQRSNSCPDHPAHALQHRRSARRRPVENVFTLFDHAFVTSTHQVDGAIYRPLTYAIVLYNTGLALHLKGMEDDEIKTTQSQSLHLAAKFYTMALEVLEESSCQDGTSSEVLLLLLSLYNNLGHIQCHFFNVKEAQQCVEWLRNLVNAKSVLLLPHLREEHSFFCLSLLIPPGSEFSLAPAA